MGEPLKYSFSLFFFEKKDDEIRGDTSSESHYCDSEDCETEWSTKPRTHLVKLWIPERFWMSWCTWKLRSLRPLIKSFFALFFIFWAQFRIRRRRRRRPFPPLNRLCDGSLTAQEFYDQLFAYSLFLLLLLRLLVRRFLYSESSCLSDWKGSRSIRQWVSDISK